MPALDDAIWKLKENGNYAPYQLISFGDVLNSEQGWRAEKGWRVRWMPKSQTSGWSESVLQRFWESWTIRLSEQWLRKSVWRKIKKWQIDWLRHLRAGDLLTKQKQKKNLRSVWVIIMRVWMHARLSLNFLPFVLSLFFCGKSIFASECCDYLLLDDVSESQGLHPLQVTNDLTKWSVTWPNNQ